MTFLPTARRPRTAAFAFLLLAPPLYGLLGLTLGMDANWDLRNYHWYNAYALLTGRLGMDMLPAQMPSFYNPLLDVPFYLLATHLPARAAGFVWGTLHGLNLALVFLLAHATLRVGTAWGRVALAALLAVMAGFGLAIDAPRPYYLLLLWSSAAGAALLAGATLACLHWRAGRWIPLALAILLVLALLAGMVVGLRSSGMPPWMHGAWSLALVTGVVVHLGALDRLRRLPHPWVQL